VQELHEDVRMKKLFGTSGIRGILDEIYFCTAYAMGIVSQGFWEIIHV